MTAEQAAVFYDIRLPRLIIGVLVGAALAVSGAVMQGVFGNPLADPGIIGVSGGAALDAVVSIALGLSTLSLYVMPLFAPHWRVDCGDHYCFIGVTQRKNSRDDFTAFRRCGQYFICGADLRCVDVYE